MTKTAAQLDAEIAEALSARKLARARKAMSAKSPPDKQVDVRMRSPDAEFILEGEEFDLPWTEEHRPLSWFRFRGVGNLKDYEKLKLDAQDHERISAISQWAKERGGLVKALHESPILAWSDGTVLDGTHRLLVALQQKLPTVTVLTAPRIE